MNESDLELILTQALTSMKDEGLDISPEKINLAELVRRTGIPRGKLRGLKKNNFVKKPHGNTGHTPINGYVIDDYKDAIIAFLKKGITNSSVIFDRIEEIGYKGSISTVKRFIADNKDLVPAVRVAVAPQGNRGRRYTTEAGEMYQMDWGFVKVTDSFGNEWTAACFVMVCHHCGFRYVEFFPSASQENLFIGMIHAFIKMGIPQYVLTDNMASVSNKRDVYGAPIFNPNYDKFQKFIGFETKLCKVAHPFTKGAVERLVRYVKENFIVGRIFLNVNDLNEQAQRWCDEKNAKLTKSRDLVPCEEHGLEPLKTLTLSFLELLPYLAPSRKVTFDGYVNYEGRLYGVPITCTSRNVLVMRTYDELKIYDPNTYVEVISHKVNWSRRPNTCKGQWSIEEAQIEEHPTMPVKARLEIKDLNRKKKFARFKF